MLTRPQHADPDMNAGLEPAARGSLRERFMDWRDRLVMKPGFRQWAARFFLTRPIARQQSSKLFDIASGFVKSQTLLACVRLGLLERLAREPAGEAALAHELGLGADAMRRLLSAAAAIDLVYRLPDGRYRLGSLGPAVVGEAGILAMVEHNATFYRDLADPLALLRNEVHPTQLEQYWAYSGADAPDALDGDRVAPYSELMAASQRMVAAEVLAVYPVSRHRRLLDVGGGEGAFIAEAGKAAPSLELGVFDLPAVVARAAANLERLGMAQRFHGAGGNFFSDPVPQGADLYTLVRVLHDHNDGEAMQLLQSIRRAMEPGATLLIAEPMADAAGAHAVGDAYFAFYLLAMGRGRARSAAEITAMLNQAGFSRIRQIRTNTPVITQLIEAGA
jgi:demethylspheroidene O-methyltransferase